MTVLDVPAVRGKARARRSRDVRGRAPWWLFVALFAGLLLMIGPFVWMLLGAFKTNADFVRTTPTLLPERWTLDNFSSLFSKRDFFRYFLNSAGIAIVVTAANVLFCSMAGYALAKLKFAGHRPLMGLTLATLMVPGSVTLVPLFVLMSKLGLVNSYAAVTVPFFAGAFGVFLMRQFMHAVPDDLLDAARIDGAGEWRIFVRIVLPLLKPALAALAVFQFLATWNNFLWPLVALTDQSKYTLPVALATFSIGQHKADYGLLMAGSIVLVAPVIVLFLALQRHFTQSIAMTGLKGCALAHTGRRTSAGGARARRRPETCPRPRR
jgi:multiple sugar transport system permease protein